MALSLHNPDSTESDNVNYEESLASEESLREWNEIVNGRDPVEAMTDLIMMTVAEDPGHTLDAIAFTVLQQTEMQQMMRSIKTPEDLRLFQQKFKCAMTIEINRKTISGKLRNLFLKLRGR